MIHYFGGTKDQESISMGKDVVARTLTNILYFTMNIQDIRCYFIKGSFFLTVTQSSTGLVNFKPFVS